MVDKKSLKIPKGQSEAVNLRRDIQWPKEKGRKYKQRSTKHYIDHLFSKITLHRRNLRKGL